MTAAEVEALQAKLAAKKKGAGATNPAPEKAPASTGAVEEILVGVSTDEARLNKTERAFLELLRTRDGVTVGIQDLTLKLAADCRYTPDFNVVRAYETSGRPLIVFYEVKGFMREDAHVKLKVAARKYSHWARFILVRRVNGVFEETEVKP